MRFEFATAGRIIFGAGALVEIGAIGASMGRCACVVTGRNVERTIGQGFSSKRSSQRPEIGQRVNPLFGHNQRFRKGFTPFFPGDLRPRIYKVNPFLFTHHIQDISHSINH